MVVGGWKNCVLIDIFSGQNSILKISWNNKNILAILNCFTHYVIFISITYQLYFVHNLAIINNFIIVYNTLCCFWTDQSKKFKFADILNYAIYYKLLKFVLLQIIRPLTQFAKKLTKREITALTNIAFMSIIFKKH